MGELKTCPRKYQLRILEGWTPRSMSVHLTFGLAFHSALEHYDHARARGASHAEGTRAAVREALRATWDPERKRPWMSEDKYKNRETLVRSVVWYLERFAEDPIETLRLANGKPAVELSFRLALDRKVPGTDEPYLLCGHLDRVGSLGSELYVVDRKTTKHQLGADYFKQYSPDNQFSLYIFAGGQVLGRPIAGIICDAAQVLVEGTRFHREPVTRTPAEIEEFVRDLNMWLAVAEFYAQEGYYPLNDKACSMYGGCPYRDVCSKTPSVRENWLKQGFEKRVWDPLSVRGDV